ncbi:MAG TPA: threonine synthase [Acidobacteriaceae bacterium]|jgi:threonine synthase|nr:threonine synthase [Acidobacteriaceae bacterium]
MIATHQLRCADCGVQTDAGAISSDFRCPHCDGLYEVIYPWSEGAGPAALQVRLPNPGGMKHLWQERRTSTLALDQSGVWRFRELLPIVRSVDRVVTLLEGNTPLYEMPRCAEIAGVDWLFAKHQGMNPTGSFKDTGMTAALSVAVERGFQWVACASTGNTSAAMAAYAARAGLRSIVFIPEGKIAWGKLSQSMDYGALTVQLKTDFDGCVKLLLELVKRFPIYLLNSVNPYRLEGQKTPAMEILEQLEWQVPEHLVVPGGNLANSSALGKGFLEMKHLGLIPRVPKISVIQAEGANPLFRWFNDDNRVMKPVKAETRATAIRIGNPASWRKSARVIEQTGGWCEQATEQEIALAKAEIGAEGVGCEPASAVTLAGLKKLVAQGRVSPGERVVLLLTGHTLKDPQYTIDYHRGELLTVEELAGASAAELVRHDMLRKPPIVLEANEDVVLKTLEQQMAMTGVGTPA